MAQDLSKLLSTGGSNMDAPVSKSGLSGYNAQGVQGGHVYTGGNRQVPGTNGMEMASDALGRLTNAGGQVLEQANALDYQRKEIAYKQQQELDATDVSNATATYHNNMNSAFQDYSNNFPADGDTTQFLEGWKKIAEPIYQGVYDSQTNDNVKRGFLESSHSVTLGTYAAAENRFFEIRQGQIQGKQASAYQKIGTALQTNPLLKTNASAVYLQAMDALHQSSVGMDAAKAPIYLQKGKEELSTMLLSSIANDDPVNATGAERALGMMNAGQVYDMPADAQVRLKDQLQNQILATRTKRMGEVYTYLKADSDNTVGNIMNGSLSSADRQAKTSMLGSMLNSPYSTADQKVWAQQELNTYKFADLAQSLDPTDKYGYNLRVEQFNPDSKFFRYPNGDRKAAKTVYSILSGMGSSYEKLWATGQNPDGSLMSAQQRNKAGIGLKLTTKEVNDWSSQFMEAANNPKEGDAVSSLMNVYQQFSKQYGNDPGLVAAGMKQLYQYDGLHLNKQRMLALQVASGLGNTTVGRKLVQIAGQDLGSLQKDWGKQVVDSAGQAKVPADFVRSVAADPGLTSLRNNPTLGVFGEQYDDIQDLTTKLASVYVNSGMSQQKAITKAVEDVTQSKSSGNILIHKDYDKDGTVNKLSSMQRNADSMEDPMNPVRNAMLHAHQSPANLLDFAKQNGLKVTSGFSKGGHNNGSLHYQGSEQDPHAVDVDHSSIKDVAAFKTRAEAAGFVVRDERSRPKGQAVWTGPHFHLEKKQLPLLPQYRMYAA